MNETQRVSVNDQVLSLVAKADKAEKADDALKFSQAACNAANAACAANTANEIGRLIRDDEGRIIGRVAVTSGRL